MKCFNCTFLNIEKYPRHASTGYGQCKEIVEPGVFQSIRIERECNKFKQAKPDVVIDRMAWWEGKNAVN